MSAQPSGKSPEYYARRVIARLAGFAPLLARESHYLAAIAGSPREFARGARIRSQDEDATLLHLLLDGWAASAVSLPNGSRQLNALCLPGDLLGLPSLALAEPIDEIVALSPVIVLRFPVDALGRLFAEHPRLGALLFLISQEERALAMERLAWTGQAPALTRLAALFVRLDERIAQLGDESDRFYVPLTQKDMGDLIGVSTVHLNAVLRELKDKGVVALEKRELRILDRELLRKVAKLQPWRRSQPAWLPPHRPEGRTD